MTPNDDCQEKCQQTNIESATTKNAPDEKTQQIGSRNDPRKAEIPTEDAGVISTSSKLLKYLNQSSSHKYIF